MKFSCTKENLIKALSCTGNVSGRQVNLPILQNVLISMKNTETRVISTNLEIAISAPLRAKVEADGEYTVPARVFYEYMSAIPGERVDIELNSDGLGVQLGSSKTVLKGMEAGEFPLIPDIDGDVTFEIKALTLQQALSQTLFACSKSDVRPELSGVLLHFNSDGNPGTLIIAATDSYRLAEKRIPIANGPNDTKRVIVPSKTISELARILSMNSKDVESVVVRVSDNQIVFLCGGIEITSRLTDGQYPNYEHIIPTEAPAKISCLKDELIRQVKGAGLFTAKGVGAVNLVFKPGEHVIEVSSTNSQTGAHDGSVTCEGDGDETSIFLNHRYLLDGLGAFTNERVVFHVIGSDSPLLIKPQMDKDYLYMIMPIKQ